jgi:superfamily II DNA or RNA helicase
MNPRGWQAAAMDWSLQRSGHRLIQAPPGTGKSFVGYCIAAQWLQQGLSHRVIWATPSIVLCEQAQATAWRYVPVPAFVCRAFIRPPASARFVVTTHQSAIRYRALAQPTDLLIFDEAHHANQHALANYATCERHAHCLGLSASPWSEGCERAFPQRWVYSLTAALSEGVLVPLRLHADTPDDSAPHTLHFMESVQDARAAAQVRRAISFVHGDRTETLALWLSGRVHDLYVCRRLGEGYDMPPCARVVLHRQTKSPIWAYQAVGRALRRHGSKSQGDAYGIHGPTADSLAYALRWADAGQAAGASSELQRLELTQN